MQRALSLEQTPPLAVPLRFFLTAPLFAISAAVLLIWYGDEALASRWSPVTLALTHLLTLGFLCASMVGALLQILPVVVGVNVPRVRLTAGVVYLLLTLGTCALSAAFLSSAPVLFKLALPILLFSFVWLLTACAYGLSRAENSSVTSTAIRLSLVALAVAVGLGAAAASAFAWPIGLPFMRLTNLHAAWGLLGWVGLLTIGVAYQVVPMFQVTPVYSRTMTRWLVPALFVLLGLWTVLNVIFQEGWHSSLLSVLAGAGYATFCIVTLYLLWHRKRPKPEATTLFWYAGIISLLACAGLWFAGELLPGVADAPAYPLALGVLFIIGFAYSVINGMLYKIVPFLVWYHLQSKLPIESGKAPNVKQILPDRGTRAQFHAHVIALIFLVVATVWPEVLARPSAFAFFVSSSWLWLNLLCAVRLYRRTLRHTEHESAA